MSEADYVARNRELWTKTNAEYTGLSAARAWSGELTWGIFGPPERELGLLGDVTGLDVIDLGCGTAFDAAWFARQGARPVGVDVTPVQLETARMLQRETGIDFPLIEASAEDVPLPSASFDLAVSIYGASLWCDPARWLPEAARLLRPGGRLVFLTNSPLSILCVPAGPGPATETLMRPQRGMHSVTWEHEDGVEFHVGHGDWIDLLHGVGLEVERLLELYASDDAEQHEYYDTATVDWAQKWPAEDVWVVRKRS